MGKDARTFNREIGLRLQHARLMRGLTQEKVAEAVGVTFQQVQKYEKGVNAVSPIKMVRYAEVLSVSIPYLFGLDEETEMEIPRLRLSFRETLGLITALQRIEERHPAGFTALCRFIKGLAKSEDPQ